MEAVGSAFAAVPATFSDSNAFAPDMSMLVIVAAAEALQHSQEGRVEV